jgi:hypothetical protein
MTPGRSAAPSRAEQVTQCGNYPFEDDETCLRHVWRERYAPDGEHAFCQRCKAEGVFKALRNGAEAPVVVLPDMRLPHPPAEGNDL